MASCSDSFGIFEYGFFKGSYDGNVPNEKQLNVLQDAETTEQFQTSVAAFLLQAEKAKETMPASLDGDQERFVGYQAAMQQVIDVAKQAEQQAQAGNLDQAKQTLEALDDMKKNITQSISNRNSKRLNFSVHSKKC
ncbi:soluble cytochrome b562 [Actinobacillus equuli]|nr:soluble cytochrome b562 [Actinobacillus equuli]